VVTNRRDRAADLVAWYDDRGTSENWIKELKLDILPSSLAQSWVHRRGQR
jgi:hypothetical protein